MLEITKPSSVLVRTNELHDFHFASLLSIEHAEKPINK
jgi:hypothetical protein